MAEVDVSRRPLLPAECHTPSFLANRSGDPPSAPIRLLPMAVASAVPSDRPTRIASCTSADLYRGGLAQCSLARNYSTPLGAPQ